MTYAFEKLEVWQYSRAFVSVIYHVTEVFPFTERFGLTSQLRRASLSVCSNIAEGSTRKTKREQARYYEIAFGSLIEILNQTIIAGDLHLLDKEQVHEIRTRIEQIGRMLTALYRSTGQKISQSSL